MKFIHGSYQNLSDRKREGHYENSILRHGRAWLRFGKKCDGLGFRWEWVLLVFRLSFGITVYHDDDDIQINFAVPGFQFYWSVQGLFPRKWKSWGFGRDTSIRFFDYGIWLNLWRDESGWDNRAKWWQTRAFCFHYLDFLLGSKKYSERELDAREAEIPMLEKTYPVKVRIYEWLHKRPRWPWGTKGLSAKVEPLDDGGIPIPGKGTAEYNCGQDAYYSMSFPAASVGEAIAKATEDILNARHRYGSIGWKPEEAKT